MPWTCTDPMTERSKFVLATDEGLFTMTELCQHFGVSRDTGYKWLRRYRTGGVAAMADHSRAPKHCPHRTPEAVEMLLVACRQQHPRWGPRKLVTYLQRRHPTGVIVCLRGEAQKVIVLGHDGPALLSGEGKVRLIGGAKHFGLRQRQDLDSTAAQALSDSPGDVLIEVVANRSHLSFALQLLPELRRRLAPHLFDESTTLANRGIDLLAMSEVVGEGGVGPQRQPWRSRRRCGRGVRAR